MGTHRRLLRQRLARVADRLGKTECVRLDGPFKTVGELGLAILSWVHSDDTARVHVALGDAAPTEYENDHHREINPRQQPLPGELAVR